MSNFPAAAGQFQLDPIGAVQHYHASVTAKPSSDVAYNKAVSEFMSDFQLLVCGGATLTQSGDSLTLRATRADGSTATYNVDTRTKTVKVAVAKGNARITYALNVGKCQVTDLEEITVLIPETLPGLDHNLHVTVGRADFPKLFDLLGVPNAVQTLEVWTECEHSCMLKQNMERLKRHDQGGPSPFMAQIFLVNPGDDYPVRSLDIIRTKKDGKSPDFLGESGRLGLFPRHYDEYYERGLAGTDLKDPQADIRFGRIPDDFNETLEEVVRLFKANPTHAGLAQLAYYLPQIARERGVIIPDVTI